MDNETASNGSSDRFVTRILIRLAVLAALGASVVTLAACGARWNGLCDLASHWRVQSAAVTSLAFVVLVLTKRWKLATLAGTMALINVAFFAPIYLPQAHGPVSGPACRIVLANVLSSNRETTRFLEFVRAEDPDILLVLEVKGHWRDVLEELADSYPHSIIRPRVDNFGIALLSRHPIQSHQVKSLDKSGIPTIVAAIDFHGRLLNVVATHPLPPVNPQRSQHHHDHLVALGELASLQPRPTIVLGDMNSTPWSPRFRDLLKRSELRDSRQGFGIHPTWPSAPRLLHIPIDHALVSEDMTVTERYVGPDIGSDHRPVVVAVGW